MNTMPKPTLPPDRQPSRKFDVMTTGKVLMLKQRDPWKESTERARQVAILRETVVLYIRQQTEQGVSQNNAVNLMLERAESGVLSAHYFAALKGAAKAGRTMPSRSAICGWCAAYKEGGVVDLLPDHKGRVVESVGWEGLALELYSQPSKPDMSAVHRQIVEVFKISCTYDQVRAYLNGIPANFGKMSPARIGRKLYKLTERKWVERCTTNLLPGDVYMADGYRADVYLAHPMTGDIWRPEIVHIIDLRSRLMVGYRVIAHEGAYDVMISWAETFARWNHVPPMLYVDNGSGYKNMLTQDESSSYYTRAGVQYVIHSIPHNPHGKGHIERYHRIVKDDFLKMWQPQFYCGEDAAPDSLSKVVTECKAKRMTPPSLASFIEAYNDWIVRYNNRPHPEDKYHTHLQIWQELSPIPPHASAREIARPAVKRIVRRAKVEMLGRHYLNADLHEWNHKEVLVEYDLMNDQSTTIRTLKGEWICDAVLVTKRDMLPTSFLDEKRAKALTDATKRLQKKMDEATKRAGQLIDVEAVAHGEFPSLEGECKRIEHDKDEIVLNLTDFN